MSAINKEFLFVDKEQADLEEIFIVSAKSKEEALYKAALIKMPKESTFMEYVGDRCVNMCFAERFFMRDKEESDIFCETGEVTVDKTEFMKRVNQYFGLKNHLAEEFILNFYSKDELIKLSDELLLYVWINDWNEYQIIDISELEIHK